MQDGSDEKNVYVTESPKGKEQRAQSSVELIAKVTNVIN